MAEPITQSPVNGAQYNKAGQAQIIFKHNVNNKYSDKVVVLPGEVAVITAFGLTKHKLVEGEPLSPWIHHTFTVSKRIVTDPSSKTITANSCGCDDTESQMSNPDIIFEDVMIPCGWKLSACNNMKVITIPGVYILTSDFFELGDPSYVEVLYDTVEHAMLYPRCAIFGN